MPTSSRIPSDSASNKTRYKSWNVKWISAFSTPISGWSTIFLEGVAYFRVIIRPSPCRQPEKKKQIGLRSTNEIWSSVFRKVFRVKKR